MMEEDSSADTEMSAKGSVSPDDPVIRILLMGRKGSGKSSSGNTILGERRFKVIKPKKKKEAEVYEEEAQIGEKQVCLINCPDLLDPDLSKEKQEELKEQLISRCSAGLSSVLLTIPLVKRVQNEEEILGNIKTLFGPEVQKYIIIMFTREDELEDEGQTIEEYLQNHEDLQQLVTECGGKFHCVNNKKESDDQRRELLLKIEGTMMENGGRFIMEGMKRRASLDNPDTNLSGDFTDSDEIQLPERKDRIRLVLLGKTGSGKSTTGNTIIGRNVFESSASTVSQTKRCQSESTVRMGKGITVIDTPGLYDTKLSENEIKTEIVKCVTFASPGPHAFIIVIRVGRFTEEEKNTIEQLKEMFGEQILKYTMFIFTHKDELEKENKTIEEYLQNDDSGLKTLLNSCGNRFFFLNNSTASFPQFKDLLRKIEMMVEENGETYFTNEMFEEAEKYIQKMQNMKLKQFKQENEQIPQAEWDKARQEAEQTFSDIFCKYIHYLYKQDIAQFLEKISEAVEETLSFIDDTESKGFTFFKAIMNSLKKEMCVIQ